MGDDCRFGHPPRSELPPVPRRKYRQQVSNGGRFRQFREWIIKTFDVADLQKGSGVLCVADGKPLHRSNGHPLAWKASYLSTSVRYIKRERNDIIEIRFCRDLTNVT